MVRSLGMLAFFLLCAIVSPAFAQTRALENQVSFIPGGAQDIWDDYAFNTLAVDDYQPGCEPMQYRPDLSTPYRGVVILLHGFTSCPKQFSAMAESFTARGYHVLVPVLPGHGRAGADEIAEQFELPGVKNWHNYDSFAHWLNKLASSISAGEIHIGGLCLGGTIATRAMQLEPELYSRALLFSPFFEVSAPLVGRLGRLMGRVGEVVKIDPQMNVPFALEKIEICEGIERKIYGRAGYCRVRLSNLIAVARFGQHVAQQWRTLGTAVQTVLVQDDPVASPETTLALLDGARGIENAPEHTCVMNASASHSMFSPTDLPQPKPWLPEMHRQLTHFLTDAQPLAQTPGQKYAWPASQRGVAACALWP